MAVDLPALERPAKAISGTVVSGRSRNWLTVVKKRACQSLDMGWGENATKGSDNARKLLYNKGLRIVVIRVALLHRAMAATIFTTDFLTWLRVFE